MRLDDDDGPNDGDIPLASRLGLGGSILLWGVIFLAFAVGAVLFLPK